MNSGRYLYCIIPGKQDRDYGAIGIGGARVYNLAQGSLSAMVHDCEAKPYDSANEKEVAGWVLSHEKVVAKAMDDYGAVLPLRFNTIIQADGEREVDGQVKRWLHDDYDALMEKLEKLWGRKEYGIQVSWDMEAVSRRIIEEEPRIQALAHEIEDMSEGLAYMKRKQLENILKKRLEEEADIVFKQYYSAINACVDQVKIERTKRLPEPKQMIMNLSCLTTDSAPLSTQLDRIEKETGMTVRFTGPWPPYSFAEG